MYPQTLVYRMVGGQKDSSDMIEDVLQYQGAPVPKSSDKNNGKNDEQSNDKNNNQNNADDIKALLKKRRYSFASTFLMLLRRFQLTPSEGGPRSTFMLGKIADVFGMQVRGRYRGNKNVTRRLSKVGLPLDGMSEVLALFLTFPWLVCPHFLVVLFLLSMLRTRAFNNLARFILTAFH